MKFGRQILFVAMLGLVLAGVGISVIEAQVSPDATWGNGASVVRQWFKQRDAEAYVLVSDAVAQMRDPAMSTGVKNAGATLHRRIMEASGAIEVGGNPDAPPTYASLAAAIKAEFEAGVAAGLITQTQADAAFAAAKTAIQEN